MSAELKPEQVVQNLERRILSGELRAGERLPTEGELGAQLGVSRTVVRDAVRTLTTRRLVRVRHGFGMEVAAPSDLPIAHALADLLMRADVTVGDVLDAREALDRHLVPLAARNATEEDVSRMTDDFERFAAAAAAGDAAVAQDAHLETLRARDGGALGHAVDHHFSVLRGGAYDRFRAARFRELLDHREFALLRGLLTSRAAAAEASL